MTDTVYHDFPAYTERGCSFCGVERQVPTGPALKAVRRAAGVTQVAAAAACHVRQSHLSRVEAGTRQPSAAILAYYRGLLTPAHDPEIEP